MCHRGPVAQASASGEQLGPSGADAGPPPTTDASATAELNKEEDEKLPEVSDDFPEEVVLDELQSEYQPAKMPHRQMVQKLNNVVRRSELAKHFHGDVDILCAGCHHNGEIGERPRPCKSCHSVGDPLRDKPGLKVAYHRQCIGCHQKTGIIEALECTDCHEKAKKEVSQ